MPCDISEGHSLQHPFASARRFLHALPSGATRGLLVRRSTAIRRCGSFLYQRRAGSRSVGACISQYRYYRQSLCVSIVTIIGSADCRANGESTPAAGASGRLGAFEQAGEIAAVNGGCRHVEPKHRGDVRKSRRQLDLRRSGIGPRVDGASERTWRNSRQPEGFSKMKGTMRFALVAVFAMWPLSGQTVSIVSAANCQPALVAEALASAFGSNLATVLPRPTLDVD